MRLRSHLVALVLVAVLPILGFALVMVVMLSNEQRASVEDGLTDTARALSLAVDRELAGSISTLEALATSEHLDAEDLRRFYDQAVRVLKAREGWPTIVLLDPSGRQLVNMRQPLGARLPPSPVPDLVRQVAETGRPAVSDLFVAAILRTPVIAVLVPVIRAGSVRYVLGAPMTPASLARVLSDQKIPAQWRATILDRQKIVIVRSTGDMVGRPASLEFSERSVASPEGAFRGTTLDGIAVYAGFSRSALSGWTVVIGAPVSIVEAPLKRSLWLIGGGGLLVLLGAMALARVVGRRIARPIRALSAAATALADADPPTPHVASRIVEVDEAARALDETAVLIRGETERRDQAQVALRAANRELDALISASPAAIIAFDGDGRITKWNSAAERIFGWSADEVLGRPFRCAQGAAEDTLGALFKRGLESEMPVNAETMCRTKRGAAVDVSVSMAPVHDFAGRPAGAIAVVLDTTERKRAEWSAQALARVGHELVGTLDVAKVTDRIVTTVFERFRAVRVSLYRLDPASRRLECVATAGDTGPGDWIGRVFQRGEGLVSVAVEEKRPIWSPDLLADARFKMPAWLREHILEEGYGPIAAVPLIARGDALGALALAYTPGHTLGKDDFRLLAVFADQAAVALENAHLYQQAEGRAQRLTRLSRLTRLITGAPSGPAVFNAIAEAAVSLLGARVARVWVADPEGQVLRALGRYGIDPEAERELLDYVAIPYGSGIPGRIFVAGRPEYIADSHDDPRSANPRFIKEFDVHGYAGLPLIAGGRVLGVLSIMFVEPKTFTDEDKELMSLLAGHGAIAISNARLYDDAERRRAEAEALADLASDVNASLDLTTILQRVGEKARETCGADVAWIALREPGSDSMVMRHSPGARHAYDDVRIEPGKGIGGQVLLTGRAFRTDNYTEDSRITNDYSYVAFAEEIVTTMVVPIPGERGIEGLLYVENRSPRPFTDRDEAMVTRLAVQAAVAINNARLHEREQQARAAAEASREVLRRVSAQLVDVQEAERRAIARELHDEIGQLLTGLKLTLETGARSGPAAARARFGEAQARIRELMERVRDLSLDLRPTMLDDLGLVPALLWHFDRYTAQTKVRVTFEHIGVDGRRFAPTVETAAFRIVQESLTNVARHSGATEATVRLWRTDNMMGVQVEDAGAGFDPGAAAVAYSSGLSGMRERAAALDGDLTIDSSAGAGTRVTCELPAGPR